MWITYNIPNIQRNLNSNWRFKFSILFSLTFMIFLFALLKWHFCARCFCCFFYAFDDLNWQVGFFSAVYSPTVHHQEGKKNSEDASSCDDSFDFDLPFAKTQTDKHICRTGNHWHCTRRPDARSTCWIVCEFCIKQRVLGMWGLGSRLMRLCRPEETGRDKVCK